jgi:hypothetical protein
MNNKFKLTLRSIFRSSQTSKLREKSSALITSAERVSFTGGHVMAFGFSVVVIFVVVFWVVVSFRVVLIDFAVDVIIFFCSSFCLALNETVMADRLVVTTFLGFLLYLSRLWLKWAAKEFWYSVCLSETSSCELLTLDWKDWGKNDENYI